MKKEEFIRRYGQEAYEKRKTCSRKWHRENVEKVREQQEIWRSKNREKLSLVSKESSRKGGKYYEKNCEYKRTGIPGERSRIRNKHGDRWRKYKNIIAIESQIHHEWIPNTSEYTGVALVEADQHMHGFIDIIEILDGNITLYTEEEIRKGY